MPISMAAVSEIEAVTALSQDAGNAAVSEALNKLAQELKSRLHSGVAISPTESRAITGALGRIRGPQHAELRIGCLIDLAHNLYVMGSPFLAIDPAKQASELASLTGMKSLERKAQYHPWNHVCRHRKHS